MAVTSGSVTIKLAGGDYSTWAAFWDDVGNLTGNLTCTVDASAFTENSAPAAITESLGGYTLHVLPASFPTKTDASDGARFTCNYTGYIFPCEMEGGGALTIEGMVFIEGTSDPSRCFSFDTITTDFTLTLRRNIVKAGSRGVWHADGSLQTVKIYNNIIFDCDTNGILCSYDLTSAVIANNTIVNVKDGIYAGDEEITFENNLVYGSTVKDYTQIEVLTVGNNNADSDATAENADWGGGGANNVNSIADPFNNLAADDFTITAEGDVGTAGKDLSGTFDGDFFSTDARSNWTIGACEYVSSGDVTVTPSALALSATLQTPTVVIDVTVTPSALSLNGAIQAPTVALELTVTPSALALSAAIPAPTVITDVTVTPSALTLTGAIPAPSVVGDVTVTPSALALSTTVTSPTVVGDVTVTPSALALSTTVTSPTVVGDVTVTPSALSLNGAIQAPTVSIGGNVTVTPSALPLSVAIPAPSVITDVTVTPSALAITGAIQAPTILIDVTVTPATLALTATLPVPTIVGDVTITPSSLSVTASILAPTVDVSGSVTVYPAALSLTVTILAPTIPQDIAVSPSTLTLLLAVQAPTISTAVEVIDTFKEAIYDILHTDAQDLTTNRLGDLLGYDPVTKPRCVFFAYPPQRVDTPLLTYRLMSESSWFPREIFIGLTIWGGNINAIRDRLFELLNKRLEITCSDFSVKAILFEGAGPRIYDENLKTYYQQDRYRAINVKT